jgi:hypothetical protein
MPLLFSSRRRIRHGRSELAEGCVPLSLFERMQTGSAEDLLCAELLECVDMGS